jgi:hypothetical protein
MSIEMLQRMLLQSSFKQKETADGPSANWIDQRYVNLEHTHKYRTADLAK